LQPLRRHSDASAERAQASAPTEKPKSRWQKLKEENEQRKANNIVYSSAEATRITGYDSQGKAATQERKEEQKRWETGENQVGTLAVYQKMLKCTVM
jgi:hypothetical protein